MGKIYLDGIRDYGVICQFNLHGFLPLMIYVPYLCIMVCRAWVNVFNYY